MAQALKPSADKLSGSSPDLCSSKLKISTPVTAAMGNVHANFGFPDASFCIRAKSPYGTDGRTNRQTDVQAAYCGLLRRPHNKASVHCQRLGVWRKSRLSSSVRCGILFITQQMNALRPWTISSQLRFYCPVTTRFIAQSREQSSTHLTSFVRLTSAKHRICSCSGLSVCKTSENVTSGF